MVMNNGMFEGVSSRTMSKDIFTSHYHGPASPELVTQNHYTAASQAIFKSPSFAFRNKSSAQTWHELMDFSTTSNC